MIGSGSNICVVGIWHLGSVYATCLASSGYQVTGVDKDPGRVVDLNRGKAPLYEPGLDERLKANIASRRLRFTTDLASATTGCSHVLITLDTPVGVNNEVDVSPVLSVAAELAPHLRNGSTVIVSSQVPVGTCEKMRATIQAANPPLDFAIAYSPENLRLGQAIECFEHPGRIVIGADEVSTLDEVEALFSFIPAPKLRMNLRAAEMSKHALNAFLATCISFANEMANLCDESNVDALKVAAALRSDGRIGPRVPLLPGLGFGGGNLARDLAVLKELGRKAGYETRLLNEVLEVNDRQTGVVLKKLKRQYGSVRGLTIGVLGLSYKAGTSSMRHSQAIRIIEDLVADKAEVRGYDPKADPGDQLLPEGLKLCSDAYQVAVNSDAIVIVTEWPEFKDLDFDRIRSVMRRPVLVDAKNMLADRDMCASGFQYFGIGRGQ